MRVLDATKGAGDKRSRTLPEPLLRFREGEAVTLRVTNELEEITSMHWHGLLVPYDMDGVPGVSFPGIKPGETFTYRFTVRQSGTYWAPWRPSLPTQAVCADESDRCLGRGERARGLDRPVGVAGEHLHADRDPPPPHRRAIALPVGPQRANGIE